MNEPDLEKSALRGEPSYVWRDGQARRLEMILEAAGHRIRGRVLDDGCGVGLYLEHLAPYTADIVGLEYDPERVMVARKRSPRLVRARGERLPFPDGYFDVVLSHEVLEHVGNDQAAVSEIVRVLRRPTSDSGQNAGRLVLFVPNRGYPFETHGIYWRGRYHFGNIPLVNYLPPKVRDRLAPHVRVYTPRRLKDLLRGLPLRVVKRTVIFGAYDNIIARSPVLGRALRTVMHVLERTPLRVLGLSHFWVLERTNGSSE